MSERPESSAAQARHEAGQPCPHVSQYIVSDSDIERGVCLPCGTPLPEEGNYDHDRTEGLDSRAAAERDDLRPMPGVPGAARSSGDGDDAGRQDRGDSGTCVPERARSVASSAAHTESRTSERKRLFWKQIEQARRDVEAWPDYLKRAFGVKP